MRILMCLAALCSSLCAQANPPYKLAVIGLLHTHVWQHLPAMIEGKDAKLVGIAEPNRELAEEAVKVGADKGLIFDDYKQMLRETKPDIVWAFVENNRHLEIAEYCAPLHINLIFEKPLASSYPDAKTMEGLASKYGIQILTNYQMAWWPANYTARNAVEAGDIGAVYSLHGIVGNGGPGAQGIKNKVFFEWLTDPVKNGGGALVDFGCYNVLWSLWYLGMPEQVYASVSHLRPDRFPKVEDEAVIVLTYPHAVGMFEGSWELPRSFQDLEVFGRSTENQHGGTIKMTRRGVEEQTSGEPKELPLDALPPGADEPIAMMVSHLRNRVQITGLTALKLNVDVVRILDLAKESASKGKAMVVSSAAEKEGKE